jgi:hypothetical protein
MSGSTAYECKQLSCSGECQCHCDVQICRVSKMTLNIPCVTEVLMTNLSSPTYATAGFVALDNVNRLIVVSFRGTDLIRFPKSNNANLVAQLQNAAPQYCHVGSNCAASKGYIEAFTEVNATVINATLALRDQNRDYQIVTTGHSQDGAIATVAALELRRRGIPVHAVSTLHFKARNP